MRQLYHRHWIRRKQARKDIAAAMPAARLLSPFRIRSMAVPGPGRPVYAASVTDAMVLASAEYGEAGYAEACDDLERLRTVGLDVPGCAAGVAPPPVCRSGVRSVRVPAARVPTASCG